MAKIPFFTIITASLNKGTSIQRTLESIINQTFKDLEHIVVDGGSTDNTLDIIKSFVGTYNLSYISEPDSGIAAALNKGLKLAKGKYVLIIQIIKTHSGLKHPLMMLNCIENQIII